MDLRVTIVHSWAGDCADVLPTLTGHGPVDVVYVDPPYNVGVPGPYLDRRGDWPGFLRARLTACLPLLAPTAVLAVSVGDTELHRLRVVADDVLGPSAYLGTVHWVGHASPKARYVAGGVDHLVLYAADRAALDASGAVFRVPKPGVGPVLAAAADAWADHPGDPVAASRAMRAWWAGLEDDHPSRTAPGVRRYMRIDGTGRLYRTTPLNKPLPRPGHRYDVVHPVTGRPCREPDNGWRHTWATMRRLLADGAVHFGPDHTQVPQGRAYLDEQGTMPLPPVVHHRRDGTTALTELVGPHDFPYPKDPEVLTWLLSALAGPGAVVLDFFAGSGTTAQAVADLDAADHGDRTVLLVTDEDTYGPYLARRLGALADAGRLTWADHGLGRPGGSRTEESA